MADKDGHLRDVKGIRLSSEAKEKLRVALQHALEVAEREKSTSANTRGTAEPSTSSAFADQLAAPAVGKKVASRKKLSDIQQLVSASGASVSSRSLHASAAPLSLASTSARADPPHRAKMATARGADGEAAKQYCTICRSKIKNLIAHSNGAAHIEKVKQFSLKCGFEIDDEDDVPVLREPARTAALYQDVEPQPPAEPLFAFPNNGEVEFDRCARALLACRLAYNYDKAELVQLGLKLFPRMIVLAVEACAASVVAVTDVYRHVGENLQHLDNIDEWFLAVGQRPVTSHRETASSPFPQPVATESDPAAPELAPLLLTDPGPQTSSAVATATISEYTL